MLWHHRLGHLNPKAMKTGQVHKLFEGIPTKSFSYISICEGCIYDKQCRQKFPISKQKKTERPLQLIQENVFLLDIVIEINKSCLEYVFCVSYPTIPNTIGAQTQIETLGPCSFTTVQNTYP